MASFATSKKSVWNVISTTTNVVSDVISNAGTLSSIATSFLDRHATLQQMSNEQAILDTIAERNLESLEHHAAIGKKMAALADSGDLVDAEASIAIARQLLADFRAKK